MIAKCENLTSNPIGENIFNCYTCIKAKVPMSRSLCDRILIQIHNVYTVHL